MISIWTVIALGVAHFIGDFILQSDWMALNKSKNSAALTIHAIVYSSCFVWVNTDFALATLITHFFTDGITSQWTSKLWFLPISQWYDKVHEEVCYQAFPKPHLRHWFFVVIGLDQLIHLVTLVLTYRVLCG